MKARSIALFLLLAAAAPSRVSAQPFCGTQPSPPKTYAHVVWIWMENHSYGDIIGSSAAPFLNQLAADCGVATNYHNISHVSLPNYIGAVTGLPLKQLQPFLGDCNPGGSCLTSAASIFAQVPSWKAYEESMTANCQPTGFVGYAVRHNPPPYLTSLSSCTTFDVPYSDLQTDLDADMLPAFAFVTPDTTDDMHDGGDPGAIQSGDTWLSTELPKILDSQAYQSGTTAVFITFDEGKGGSIGEDCLRNPRDESCHVATFAIAPSVRPGTMVTHRLNHYSLLKTSEELLGLPHALGRARAAVSMRRSFNL